MKINGGIRYCEKGLTASLRAMHVQSELIGMYNENVTGFDKIGYQRKDPIVSSFTEYIGIHGLSQTIDDKVGRIAMSDNPLDLALANKGYFQTQTAEGVKLTRDGRFNVVQLVHQLKQQGKFSNLPSVKQLFQYHVHP